MPLKYCPQCSQKLITKPEGGFDRLACPDEACAWVFWDNPAPVVAGIVEYGDNVILIQNQEWPSGWYGLVTGFLERDETAEEGMLRELEEELGLKGEIVSLVGVYSFYRMNQIIIAYHVTASGEINMGEELSDYKVIPIEKVQPWDSATGYALRDWLQARGIVKDTLPRIRDAN